MKLLSISTDIRRIDAHCQDVWECDIQTVSEKDTLPFIDWLEQLELQLLQNGVSQPIDVVLATGCQTSNGHAVLVDKKPTAWISVSNYPTQETLQVFVTHEVMHALHYAAIPGYSFTTQKEKNHVGRQLVTEGLATYSTQQLLGLTESNALWADYLPANDLEKLMNEYVQFQRDSAKNILADWNSSDSLYFYANSRANVDTYRSGYYLGRLIIERIVKSKKWSALDVINVPRIELDALVKEQLLLLAKE